MRDCPKERTDTDFRAGVTCRGCELSPSIIANIVKSVTFLAIVPLAVHLAVATVGTSSSISSC
jgi:hypothetical protein